MTTKKPREDYWPVYQVLTKRLGDRRFMRLMDAVSVKVGRELGLDEFTWAMAAAIVGETPAPKAAPASAVKLLKALKSGELDLKPIVDAAIERWVRAHPDEARELRVAIMGQYFKVPREYRR
jgi:hypothetical protein